MQRVQMYTKIDSQFRVFRKFCHGVTRGEATKIGFSSTLKSRPCTVSRLTSAFFLSFEQTDVSIILTLPLSHMVSNKAKDLEICLFYYFFRTPRRLNHEQANKRQNDMLAFVGNGILLCKTNMPTVCKTLCGKNLV